ncbi:MAG: DUF302 domain-containing protein [Calditrichaeota bacterium]|nr:DUF302 domain-containing protein [Calditrichota bacterium]
MQNTTQKKRTLLFILAILMVGLMLPLQQAQSQDTGLVNVTVNGTFNATVEKFKKMVAKNGMMILGEVNQGKIMSMTGLKLSATSLFVGNPTIGKKLFSANPGIGVAVPIRVSVFEDKVGKVHVSYVKPSKQFAPFQDKQITMVGQKMEDTLAKLTGMLAK